MDLKIGMQVHGRVTGIQPYGAFVEIAPHKQGLIHISECHEGYVKDIHDYLKVNQEVDAVILDIDEYTGKVSLSLRETETNAKPVKKNHRKVYWTNHTLHLGFQPIAERREGWRKEALRNLKNQ